MSKIACFITACALFGCAAAPSSVREPAPNEAPRGTAERARDVCESVMRRTRECGALYVPALLRTRAQFDQPPGIAARYEAEGEDALLPIAHDEFRRDWSEEGIVRHCDALLAMPPERRDAVAERDAACLPVAADCAEFVECNMELLRRRWSAPRVERQKGQNNGIASPLTSSTRSWSGRPSRTKSAKR